MVEGITQASMVALAQEGDFRALAYWLNVQLVSQGIYARVAADRPGCVLVLVEFLRLPQSDRLNRFVCHRLCQLNSPIIKGVRIIARFLGTSELLWDRSIRLYTPANGQKRAGQRGRRAARPQRRLTAANLKRAIAIPTLPDGLQHLLVQAAALGDHPRQIGRSQIMTLGGFAAAAFLLGVGSEVLVHTPPGQLGAPVATRPRMVQTTGGRVPVLQTVTSAAPAPVTLTFGNPTPQLTAAAGVTAAPHPTGATPAPAAKATDSTPPSLPLADVALTHLGPEIAALTLPAADSQAIAPTAALQPPLIPTPPTDPETLTQTLTALNQSGLRPVGIGRNAGEARRPEIVDVRGQRIAYLSYTDSEAQSAGFWKAGTNPALSDRIAADIQTLRPQVDWVVVNYHWNQPLASYPSDHQIQLSRFAVDQGADLVVGYHPEVLQGAEIYKGRAIAYSLGDFLFPGQSQATKTDYETALLKVAIKDHQMRVEFLPVAVQQSQAAIAPPERRRQILDYLEKASALFQQPLHSPAILSRPPLPLASPAAASPESTTAPATPAPDSRQSTPQPLDEPAPTAAPAKSTDTFVAPAAPEPQASPDDSFIRQPTAPDQPTSEPAAEATPAAPLALPPNEEAIAPAAVSPTPQDEEAIAPSSKPARLPKPAAEKPAEPARLPAAAPAEREAAPILPARPEAAPILPASDIAPTPPALIKPEPQAE